MNRPPENQEDCGNLHWLAWSYGFLDLDKRTRGERHRRFHELVAQLVKGTRAGLALAASLQRARNQVQTEHAATPR
jgi:hypothetical protein